MESYREAIVQIAKGDFRQDSDLDIMILADIQPDETGSYSDRIYVVEVQYGMEINPSILSIRTYEQWKNVYPFFMMNIENEGVAV